MESLLFTAKVYRQWIAFPTIKLYSLSIDSDIGVAVGSFWQNR